MTETKRKKQEASRPMLVKQARFFGESLSPEQYAQECAKDLADGNASTHNLEYFKQYRKGE